MKKLVAFAAVMVAGMIAMAGNDWVTPVVSTNNVVKEGTVGLNDVMIRIDTNGAMSVMVGWTWTEKDAKFPRRGMTRYTNEAALNALLQVKGTSIAQLRNLFMGLAAYEAAK